MARNRGTGCAKKDRKSQVAVGYLRHPTEELLRTVVRGIVLGHLLGLLDKAIEFAATLDEPAFVGQPNSLVELLNKRFLIGEGRNDC